jgi:protein tyrosine/serine phosphatase
MILRFKRVNDNLYRGGAPSINDVLKLKRLGINKIVSLDEKAGQHIDRACKLLHIQHIMLPIEINKRMSLIKFLNTDIEKLLSDNGPVFIHCSAGKDRCGLAIALYRCKVDDWSPNSAIKEAKSFGFGVDIPPKITKLYEKIIHKSCPKSDNNSAYDIVSNEREYPNDYRDYTLGDWEQQSWSPYEDYRVKEFPFSETHIEWPEQYPTREDFKSDEFFPNLNSATVPQIGSYDTSTNGIMGAGPSIVGGGGFE